MLVQRMGNIYSVHILIHKDDSEVFQIRHIKPSQWKDTVPAGIDEYGW